ncbi:MAG: MFS transporter [Candidatus Omnitrophica bacterium CG12_big_fil_rev_8_21_14_0_65_42_8]|nr:MAG: MFS transporter [Candidatus Omnitrophica bacterium CG12_big_fil_rev_8_21_14_0_65_42_8]
MPKKWLNKNLVGMSAASFFSDFCHEMATAILPAFLASIGASAALLGTIEGFADAVSSFAKLGAGYYSDKKGIRKGIAVLGYFLTAAGKASFALAVIWPQVLAGRIISWFGRGIRGPVRDAMLSASVEKEDAGKAFGFHRTMDTLGAIAGPLAAFLLITMFNYRQIFWMTLIPGLLSVAAFLFLVREVAEKPAPHLRFLPTLRMLPDKFKRYLIGVGVFGSGDFSHTLLILMAGQVLKPIYGPFIAASSSIMLYIIHNVFYAGVSFPIGRLSDSLDKRKMLSMGYVLSAVMCAGFIFIVPKFWYLAGLFILGGIYIASEDVLERTIASELLPSDLKATGYGALATVNGIGDFVSSIIVGLLWAYVSPAAGFLYAGILSISGAFIIWKLK